MSGATRAGRVLVEAGLATLQFERHLPQPPEEVWDVITSPEHLARWYMTRATIEPRVGGAIEFWSGGAKVHVTGRILAWDPPRLFEHERKIEPTPEMPLREDSVIRWELEPDSTGGTILRLTHRRLAPGMATQIAPATHALLDRLEDEAAGRALRDFGRAMGEARVHYSS